MESTATAVEPSVELLDVGAVAHILSCSTRHVYRLADAGRMPKPVKLGSLVRWPKKAVVDWIAGGCPDCREEGPANACRLLSTG